MRLIPKALAAAVAVAALTPAVASAVPAHNGTFTPSGQPTYLTPGPDGNVWFSITGSTTNKELGKIAPNGTITEYDTPNDRAIVGITVGPDTAGGPNNRIWASYNGGVVKWNPANNTGTDHPIATLSGPRDIAPDGAGAIWAVAGDRLVKIKASDGTKIDDVHAGAIGGRDIVLGSDGRMWVADFGSQAITAVGTAAPYPKQSFPTSVAPQGIAAGPAGQLGIALPNSKMGRITTAGAITETTDNATDAFGTAFGADGAYWFAQFNTNTLGRLTPAGGYSKPISLPGAGPRHISAGPNNTLWVSGETSKKIYRITGVTPPKNGGGGGGGGGGGADTVKPKFSRAKVSASKRRFTFTLSEAASLRLRVDQRLKGQRRGGKCRTIKRGRRGRKCTLWKNRRSILVEGRAGRNTVSLGRKLGPGTYRLVARATDEAGNASKKTIRFKVKAKKRQRR